MKPNKSLKSARTLQLKLESLRKQFAGLRQLTGSLNEEERWAKIRKEQWK